MTQRDLANAFRALHGQGAPVLVLPTAWDAASARLIENAGATAIATTSLGMANILGYSDGEKFVPRDDFLWLAERIVRSVRLPVSLDIEAGYGDPERMTADVIKIGAVGVNVEDHRGSDDDGVSPVAEAVRVIKAIRRVGEKAGIPIVINARTDLLGFGGSLDEVIERCNAYIDAGADCAFPVGLTEKADIARVVVAVRGPVNIILRVGMPSVAELAALGVRRVSFAIFRAAVSFIEKTAREFLSAGTTELAKGQQPYPDLNNLHRVREGQITQT